MTLNAWFRPPLDARVSEIAAWIEAAAPHLVCLQEVEATVPAGGTVADRLALVLAGGWFVGYAGFLGRRGTVIGTAVLSRWPIEDQAGLQLACDDSVCKSALHVRTSGIDVFSVHLAAAPGGAGTRERQVLQLDAFVGERSDPSAALPAIVAGDFNSTPGSSAIRFLRGEQSLADRSTFYQDAWAVAGDGGPGYTWSRTNPHTPPAHLYDARCDYIFVGLPRVPISWSAGNPDTEPIGQVTAASLVCHYPRTGTFASDHFGVTADIGHPRQPPC